MRYNGLYFLDSIALVFWVASISLSLIVKFFVVLNIVVLCPWDLAAI